MKVLLISHNCFSTHQNMGKTFVSLFSEFEKDDICQFYIYPTLPDVDVCHSYFRMTDKEALQSFFTRKIAGREILQTELELDKHALFEDETDIALYRAPANKTALRRLLRDFMWKFSRWNNPRLKEWLDREKPDCILVAPGYAKFIYDIALVISQSRRIPIVTYLCDDYYFMESPGGVIGNLYHRLLKSKTNQLLKKSECLITISQEMAEQYREHFELDTKVIMTGVSPKILSDPINKDSRTSVSYFGNISCNRHESLAEFGRVLEQLNREKGTAFNLKVYTAERDPDNLKVFEGIETIRLMSFLTGEQFLKELKNADFLLHVEGFGESSIDRVRGSFSSKIADCLGSGVPMIAFGPPEVASMAHLLRNNCAFAATDKESLYSVLNSAFFSPQECSRVTDTAKKTVALFHNTEKNSCDLKILLESVTKDDE